ncbi:MAG: 2-oxo acid dehydrogenase subunit E2 [Bacillaceae bacterium]|jgi:pyruvate dehydrogenase E2 component (dihydrolipoamide acetyltransferase)|uniref:Dihydrolipoamide acetyltransferase component of pyruvate dehydrogenase complex n=1 Tax=Aeribacillus composti TaxID=1868734 RepID=A0ABY9WEF7_9BACI|nr:MULTISPECIES: dihydrolipoamide acetyltransferase family protein [Aeribacillus]REJ18371.1 MAG: 2-oxo acid dehydrogenase subunit E2 [Bacillaceae bacterium]KZM57636.1 branched-chain alpha-keto acid dehydrogenase subunit E2 [Aeribacillus pallidus]MED0651805.1 dihydrolipoamide acetyltransferase family protein [Aeribacillus composti]MED4486339.1 dihydrolipoamide acetyltransferase family protein [Aeribacillus pallidus]WNF33592.1 dihydrolipoamide acetyltransferase family protein [Aeribacillus compo
MAKEIFMPKLSSTMEVGTLLQWFKEEGESVDIGEPLFEIMTDKINIEVEAYDRGILLKKYFQPDDQIPVNQVIGYIGEPGEKVPDEPPALSEESNEQSVEKTEQSETNEDAVEVKSNENGKVRATPAARRLAKEAQVDLRNIVGSGPKGRIHLKDVKQYLETEKAQPKASPLARKIAEHENIDLKALQGSGAGGKVMKQDVINAIQASSQKAQQPEVRKKLSGLRKVVADRMVQSAFTAPHVTLASDIDMTKAIEMRTALLPVVEKQTGFRLTYTDIIIKAVGTALSRFPEVNVHLEHDEIIYKNEVNVGVAVAVKDGLMVPVIKQVEQKGLAAICAEAKDLSKRAREQKLRPDELKGSTFTISNLGMYPIDVFTPIINQPEIAILGVGRTQEKPVVVNGEIVIRPMMTVSLSFDHRVIDGAPAAEFLAEVKRILENPYEMIL